MADLLELERSIIEQSLEPDGICTLIRDRKFDDEKCAKLIGTLTEYRNTFGQPVYIGREIAGYLWAIEDIFLVPSIHSGRNDITIEFSQKVKAASSEMNNLMDDIFKLPTVIEPSLDDIEHNIVALWWDGDLIHLLPENKIDDNKVQQLIRLMREYHQNAVNGTSLKRSVVACLRTFEVVFALTEAKQINWVADRSDMGYKIHLAFAEIWSLMNDIFFDSTGNVTWFP